MMTMTQNPQTSHPLTYEIPAGRPRSRTWAAVAILLGGLALVGLGGCFLIGVMIIIEPQSFFGPLAKAPLTGREIAFVAILCALAIACFAAAALMLFLGTRALLRVTRMA
jgi:hypothetical protein